MKKSVIVVEDDSRLRAQLLQILQDLQDIHCIGACGSAEEALEVVPRKKPDVVLMDIKLPGMSGIQCVYELKKVLPALQVIMVTVYEDSERIFKALKAGASGYLVKSGPPEQLVEAIRDVFSGGAPMSGPIARKVVQYFNQRGSNSKEIEKLSKREHEVLEHLAQGIAYKEIADVLSLSIDTVRMHIKGIYGKLHVHSRGEAVAKYLRK